MNPNEIVEWTRGWFTNNRRDTAVLGISGGKDSAVVAAVLAKAIGPENVYGIMMPNGHQSDLEDSKIVIQALGIQGRFVNIGSAYEAILGGCGNVTSEAAINVAPRLRMTALYAIAQSLSSEGKQACVVGTGNLAERYIGYCTKWGDMGCDVDLLGRLWVSEVIELGEALAPELTDIIRKKPDDGLCGMTDEERLGFTYQEVADLVGRRAQVMPEHKKKIEAMHNAAMHKLTPPQCFTTNPFIN